MVGLVCDSVANLLEVQCVKRNAKGSTNVIVDTERALVGTISSIPCYEVVHANKKSFKQCQLH